MRLTLVRNATLRLTYADRVLLVDPFLAPRHSQPSLAGVSLNPTVDLPVPEDDVTRGAELVWVSHLHRDHLDLDPVRLPTNLRLLAQPGDVGALRTAGFTDVTPLEREETWNGIHLTRTTGTHGTGPVGEAMGQVSGLVLRAEGEPTVYLAGDTLLTDDVREVLARHRPDVIVTHSGGAVIAGTLIIMDAEQTVTLAREARDATIVAVHLEAYDHMTVTRDALNAAITRADLSERVLVPNDGETVAFERPVPTR